MKLDPEDQIITAALAQAALEEADERLASAWIEFSREGHTKVSMTISRELVDKARALNWSTGELLAEAIRTTLPGAFDLEARGRASPGAA